MTTFQDPPPQSRRAVRQGERGESAESAAGFTQQAADAPQFYSDPNAARDMWDTTARRAAQLPPAAPPQGSPVASGRRAAAAPAQPTPVAEPLTYSTQARPQVPSYDGPSFRNRPNAMPQQDAVGTDLPPTEAIPQAERPAYRVRDFSPDARRAVQDPPLWNPPAAAPPASDLEYHTEARAPAPAAPVPVAEIRPAVAPQPLPAERTLSRREFRAIQHTDEASSIQAQAPAASQYTAYPVPAPEEHNLPQVAPEPSTNTALTDALAEFDALTRSQPSSSPAIEPQGEDEAAPWTPPIGHWSTQADLDDETQPNESTINRTIGSGSTTTNALVLPAIPRGADIRRPLTGTGEIMLTGSIDLPRNLSSTGASDRFDQDGLDALFDVSDSEVISTDSAPVRAIRAVSTHSSGHGVTHTQKPKGNRALVALLISASSMAVVVAGLLVAAFAFNVF